MVSMSPSKLRGVRSICGQLKSSRMGAAGRRRNDPRAEADWE